MKPFRCLVLMAVPGLIFTGTLFGQVVPPDSVVKVRLPFEEVFVYQKLNTGNEQHLLKGEAGTASFASPNHGQRTSMHFGNASYSYEQSNRGSSLFVGDTLISQTGGVLILRDAEYVMKNKSDDLYMFQGEELYFVFKSKRVKGQRTITLLSASPLTHDQRVALLSLGFNRIESVKRSSSRLAVSLVALAVSMLMLNNS